MSEHKAFSSYIYIYIYIYKTRYWKVDFIHSWTFCQMFYVKSTSEHLNLWWSCRERINKKNLNWIKKQNKKPLKFAETPRVPWQEKGMTHVKRKKATSWQRGTGFLSLSGGDQRFDNNFLLSGVCAPRIRLWTWRWLVPFTQ